MPGEKKRVIFVTINFAGCGAQRVLSLLLRYLDRTKFEPVLVIFINTIEYPLPPDVSVVCLNKKNWWDYPVLVWKLSRVYRKWHPATVLSFLQYANVIAVLAKIISFTRFKCILSERGLPSYGLLHSKSPLDIIFGKWLPSWFYRYADEIICVSNSVAMEVHRIYGIPLKKTKVLYNPLDIDEISVLSEKSVGHPWFSEDRPVIISVGRLSAVKGYPFLLRAFKRILENYTCRLVILGKGEEEESLKDLTRQLDIVDHVAFLGFQPNPYKFMKRSRIFVLASLSEGFPNVILEALSCGLPLVTTDCPGALEIINDGVNGLVVPKNNEEQMSKSILRILSDKALANKFIEEGKKTAIRFTIDKTVKEYENLF